MNDISFSINSQDKTISLWGWLNGFWQPKNHLPHNWVIREIINNGLPS
ncbi:uncharacterized protein METZ01_LOCUS185816 [marine metagenome]|uniref:Uncharacterized protein n=1 Tax=marine metagenome TaxID=408172 RepID=A0A382D4I8_9ZZZZ